jgi:hypothetical protein
MATIHLTRGAPKSARLDEASIRKRAATKGDVIVEVKPGEEVVSVNVGWTVEKFVTVPNGRANGHKSADGGKKNGRVKASVDGKAPAAKKKVASGKKSPVKGKAAPARKAKAPVKKSAPKKTAAKQAKAKKKSNK